MSNGFHDRLIEIDYIILGDYEWAEWHAYYDPETRLYFVHWDSGCSCNFYDLGDLSESEGLHSKHDVIRYLNEWAGSVSPLGVSAGEVSEVRGKILAFRAPKK